MQVIILWSQNYGVPPWIPLCIAYAETSINPGEVGDNGTSYGLFQLHTPGGQGDVWPQYGSSPSALLDPTANCKIGIRPIAQAYKYGVERNLSGFSLLQYAADHAGHPDDTGYMPNYYLSRLQLAYGIAQKANWFSIGIAPNANQASDNVGVHATNTPGGFGTGVGSGTGGTSSAARRPNCANYGTYVGEGTAAGIHAGLYLFAETVNGVKINSVVDQSCQLVAQYTHGTPKTGTPSTGAGTVSTITKTIISTAKSPINYAIIAVGLGLGLGGLYYLERQHGVKLFRGR